MQTLKKRVNETVDVTSAVKKLKSLRNDPSVTKEETALLWEQVKVSGEPTLKREWGGRE